MASECYLLLFHGIGMPYVHSDVDPGFPYYEVIIAFLPRVALLKIEARVEHDI